MIAWRLRFVLSFPDVRLSFSATQLGFSAVDRSSQGITSRYLGPLLAVVQDWGGRRDQVLASAGIDGLDDPQTRVSNRQMERLVEAAEQATGRADLGFELGLRLKLTAADVLGYAWLTSSTLGSALQLAATYSRLTMPAFKARLRRQGETAELSLRPAIPMSPRVLHFYLEAYLVAIHVQIQDLIRTRLPAYDMHLSIQRPSHAARYRELAPARVHFGDPEGPSGRVVLSAALLERRLPMADAQAQQAAEARCKSLLYDIGRRGDWSSWCAMILREAEDHLPTLDELARLLNLSPRTLARYLEREDTSFRALSRDIRTERARHMLTDGHLSVSQIAYRLGYTDVANLSRSFRKAVGCSPGEYRRRAAEGSSRA